MTALAQEFGISDRGLAKVCSRHRIPVPPRGALRAVRPLLKPGARFAAFVYSTPANNPFMALPMEILLRHAGKPPPPPGSPGIFALGGEGVLERLLSDSGFADLKTERVQARIVLPSAAEALHLMQEAAGAYRAVVADLDEQAKSRAWDEVYDGMEQFDDGSQFKTRLEVIVASGVNPD